MNLFLERGVFLSKHLGKWQQYVLLQQNFITAKCIPETTLYSMNNLLDFLNRYDYVYVKHDTTGQGRAMYKVFKNSDGLFCFNGFNVQGEPNHKCVRAIKDFHKLLHPFEQFGRSNGNYIIQEGIKSLSKNKQPFHIRVHLQLLKGKWNVGGMFGMVGVGPATNTGIVNSHRGGQALSVDELLSTHLLMDTKEKMDVISCLNNISIAAAEVISPYFPSREYGIDLGIHYDGKPVIFEVNSTPGIGVFARIENKAIWRRIVEIRKMQSKE